MSSLKPADAVLLGEAHQQPQLGLLAVVLAAERALVLHEAADASSSSVSSCEHLLAVTEGDLAQATRQPPWRRSPSSVGERCPTKSPIVFSAKSASTSRCTQRVAQGVRAGPGTWIPAFSRYCVAQLGDRGVR